MATGWTPWCAAPPQSGQEPKSETQHLCVQYALQDPQLQEQGEERKVWGSRFCHTQMTVCGGLFFRKPRRIPPPQSLLLPPSHCSRHLGQLETKACTVDTPPLPPCCLTLRGCRANSWTLEQTPQPPLQAGPGKAGTALPFHPPGRSPRPA